jgi:Ca2+-binding EF-hand superfamily protein
MVDHADTDNDGRVSRAEFRAAMADLSSRAPIVDSVEGAINAVFSVLDSDDDDQVPVTEVVRMFTKSGVSDQDAAQSAQALDLNNDGVITRKEYTTVWLGYFTDNDPNTPASRILGNLD